MSLQLYDGMSAVEFKNEIESKAIDKTGDDLGEYVSIKEKPVDSYVENDIIPHSFIYNSVDSMTLFFAYYGFSDIENMTAMIDIAFGKNCESMIYSLGAQLWNFHTVIGDTATSVPTGDGETLANCKTLAEIKASALAMSQLSNFPALRKLIVASPYAKRQLGVTWTS